MGLGQETRTRKKYAASRPARARVARGGEAPAFGFQEVVPVVTPGEAEAEQQRRQAVLAGLFARAQALVPDAPDSPTRKACRESPLDEIIVEKFRRQGFNL